MAGLNFDLLAGLFAQMTRMTELIRVRKILSKKAESRTKTDLKRLVEETGEMKLLSKRGVAAHMDMCHGVQLKMLEEDEILTAADLPAKGECYIMVLSGRVWLETTDTKPFDGAKRDKSVKEGEKGPKQVTEQEMLDLFRSIDLDDGGTIDVEELGYALEMMGMHMSQDKVEELMEGVDEDGSGELDFDEFKLILREKLGIGKVITSDWELKGDKWSRYCGEGATFGENSVTSNVGGMRGKVMATEDTDLVYITKAKYNDILENGFGGDLAKKVELLKAHSVAKRCIIKSDYKRLAHACTLEVITTQTVLVKQGSVGEDVIFLCGGTCKVQERREVAQAVTHGKMQSETGVLNLRKVGMSVHRSGNKRFEMVDLAYLSAGDMVGGAALLQEEHKYGVVAVPTTTVLRIKQKDIITLLHPADVEALKESTKESEQWREGHSKASQNAANRQLKRAQTLKQLAHAVEMMEGPEAMGKSSLGSGRMETSLPGIHEAEMMSQIGEQGLSISSGLREASFSMHGKRPTFSALEGNRQQSEAGPWQDNGLSSLSSNPRKLREQLGTPGSGPGGIGSTRNMSKSRRWARVQNTVSAIQELKARDGVNVRTEDMLSMLGGVASGKVGVKEAMKAMRRGGNDVNNILRELAKKATKELTSVIDDEHDDSRPRASSTEMEHETTDDKHASMILPHRNGPRQFLPNRPGSFDVVARPSMDSVLAGLQLPQLMGRRERNAVEILPNVTVGDAAREFKNAGPGGFMEYALGATECSTVAFPWRKDEPKRATEEEREAERRRRRQEEEAAAQNKSAGSKRRGVQRSDTFKQLESALEETMVRTNNGADAAQVGISKGHLNKLKRTIGVIMWLKSRVGGSKGPEREGSNAGDADGEVDAGESSGSSSEGEGGGESQFTEQRSTDSVPKASAASTAAAARVPKLKLGGLARTPSKAPRGELKFAEDVTYERGSEERRSNDGDPPDDGTADASRGQPLGADQASTSNSLLPGLESATFRPPHPAQTDGDASVGDGGGSAFLTQFFAPPPADDTTPSYVPDHSEVEGFATHRERRRPAAAQPPTSAPPLPPPPSASTQPTTSHQRQQQWYGIAYTPGVKPWTPRGGASPRTSFGFQGGPLRKEQQGGAPPGSSGGGVFPKRALAPNRGWHTDRGAHGGSYLHAASGWAVEMPGSTMDLLKGEHSLQQLPKLMPSDLRTQVKHAKLCMPRGSDGSVDSSRMVLKPSCFNARIRTPR